MPERVIAVSDLASAHELADLCGVNVETVFSWRQRHADFPAPIAELGQKMLVFSLSDMRAWAIKTGRLTEDGVPVKSKGGRKPKPISSDDP